MGGARLIPPGIGWALLAGELAWHLLIKKIDWSRFEWLNFQWLDILPKWNWSMIIPKLSQVDLAVASKESVVASGTLDLSTMTPEQKAHLEKMAAWREKTHGKPLAIKVETPETLLAAAKAAERLETQFPVITAAANAALTAVNQILASLTASLAALDFTPDGARLVRSIATGNAVAAGGAVQSAAAKIGATIQNALPKGAQVGVTVTGTAAVQGGGA